MVKASHSVAAQIAVATLILSALVLGLPAFAEEATTTAAVQPIDTLFAGKIVNQFQRPGLVSSYSNTSVTTSAFDFQAYMRDICFDPTANDMASCEAKYGPYANLKNSLMNGQLLSMLKLFGILSDNNADLVRSVQNQVLAGSIPAVTTVTDTADVVRSVAARSAEVWRVCKAHYTEQSDLRDCFQRNQRLVTRTDVPVQGNIH